MKKVLFAILLMCGCTTHKTEITVSRSVLVESTGGLNGHGPYYSVCGTSSRAEGICFASSLDYYMPGSLVCVGWFDNRWIVVPCAEVDR